MAAVETERLNKVYTTRKKNPGIQGAVKALFSREVNRIEAVKSIDLRIEQGELVGFLGPNGAGKTTTLKMLSGILHPTSGTARVLGYDPRQRKPEMLRQIALLMGNKMQLWWDLPAWESFMVLKELYEVPEAKFKKRIDMLIETLNLKDKVHTQVRRLSLGERMKCELAASLLHAPRVVFLDEPTLGLDVVSQKAIRDFLKEVHAEDGCTILLTSHYMQDVQELARRVIVIDHGTLIFDGTLAELSKRFGQTRRLTLSFSQPVEQHELTGYGRLLDLPEGGGALQTATLEIEDASVPQITAAVLQQLPVADLSVEQTEIEDVIRRLFTEKH